MKKEIVWQTTTPSETRKRGEKLAKKLKKNPPFRPLIIALKGPLGGGKTTFAQGFARGLGIKEKILSPTFVIRKRFPLRSCFFSNLYHLDCYRIPTPKELISLGIKEILNNQENIILIEWPEKIKKLLRKPFIEISFSFLKKGRQIRIKTYE